MPTRSAFAPRRCPAGFAFFFGFPQYEVCGIFLCVVDGYTFAGTGNQFIQILSGQFAVFREFLCIIVNSAIVFISKTFVDQFLNHCNDTVHFLCNTRMYSSTFYVQTVSIVECFFNITIGDCFHCAVFFVCTVDDLVVNVCEVLYISNVITFVFQVSSYGVKYNIRACVTDMDIVIYGRAANVHFYFAFLARNEFFFLSCQCIIYFHGRSSFLF